MHPTLRERVDTHFYAGMTLLIAAVIVYGFSRTIGDGLLHASPRPPLILYVHAAVFSSWVLLLLVQSACVRLSRVRVHRSLGIAGLILGAAMPLLGIATKMITTRQAFSGAVPADELSFSAISLNDMLSFGVVFALGMCWRRRPEYHRRLMIIASCCLTVAAFARFPGTIVIPPYWYLYVDALIALGVLRDYLMMGRVHIVYRVALPALAAGQSLAMYLYLAAPPMWLSAMRWAYS